MRLNDGIPDKLEEFKLFRQDIVDAPCSGEDVQKDENAAKVKKGRFEPEVSRSKAVLHSAGRSETGGLWYIPRARSIRRKTKVW